MQINDAAVPALMFFVQMANYASRGTRILFRRLGPGVEIWQRPRKSDQLMRASSSGRGERASGWQKLAGHDEVQGGVFEVEVGERAA